MDDLVSWLEAQIVEDERGGEEACVHVDLCISDGCGWCGQLNDRVLAECEAKRRVIKLYTNALHAHRAGSVSYYNRTQDEAAVDVLGAAVQEYGAMYAKLGRPGYQESWKPT